MFDFSDDLNKKNLTLVDGHSTLYAGYFATLKADMRNSKGEPTGAFHVFKRAIDEVLDEYPSYIAVIFDKMIANNNPEGDENKGFSFRRNIDADYKSHRSKINEDLVAQISLSKEYLTKINVPYVEIAGIEADDIIASIVDKFNEQVCIQIITRDSDLLHLCEYKNVSVKLQKHGGSIVLDYHNTIKQYGFTPEQLKNIKILAGDRTDNIKGLPKCGHVTAKKLVLEYGSIENIIKQAEAGNLRPDKLNNLITSNLDTLKKSAQMVSPFFIDIDFNLDFLRRKPYDLSEVEIFLKDTYYADN